MRDVTLCDRDESVGMVPDVFTSEAALRPNAIALSRTRVSAASSPTSRPSLTRFAKKAFSDGVGPAAFSVKPSSQTIASSS